MPNKKNIILIRADSSSTIGTGHIMRDLVLASQLQKEFPHAKIVFATQNLQGNINHKITEAGYENINLMTNNNEELLKLLKAQDVDLLVLDHYEIDFNYESSIKENSNVQIMALDDTYERHNCDILLNHNISAKAKKYKKLVPKHCEIRCGAQFTLLRDEFLKEKKKKRKVKRKNSKVNIYVAMGGADTANLNIKILKTLKKFKNIQVNLVTTSANKNLEALQKYVENKKWIKLYIDSTKIAKLMRKSDFAIITPSVTANEVYFMGLPFIAIKTAENQDDMYKFLKQKKYLVLKQFSSTQLEKRVQEILKNIHRDEK